MISLQDFAPTSEPAQTGYTYHYFARELKTGQQVSVEVFPSARQHVSFSAELFETQAQKLMDFQHPSVLEVLAYGWDGNNAYLIRKTPPGQSLAEKLQTNKRLSLEELVSIFEQICPALDAAHQQGILHQDIRPENIFLAPEGQAYLTNFGFAGFSTTSLAFTGSPIIGDPKVLSPEQTTQKRLDARSDVYQLGLLLYTVLTGLLPFQSNSGLGYAIQNILDKAPSPRPFVRKIPRGLEGLVFRALEKDPDHRIQTAHEFLEKLQLVAAGKPPTVLRLYEKQITAPDRQANRARLLHQGLRWGFRGVLLLVALAFFWWVGVNLNVLAKPQNAILASLIIPSRTPTPTLTSTPAPLPTLPPSVTPSPIPSPTLTPSPISTATPFPTPTPTLTPTSTTLPFAQGGADKIAFVSNNDIWIVNVDGTGLEQITFDGNVKFDLQWLSDRATIKYLTAECVRAANIDTKTTEQIECGNYSAYEISPDESAVAISDGDEFQLYSLSDSYSKGSRTCTYRFEEAKEIRWPDRGDLIAVVGKTTEEELQVNVVRLLDLTICSDPEIIDEFPGLRFSMRGFDKDPIIQDFDWDGVRRFVLIGPQRNDGFGFMYVYDTITGHVQAIDPLGKNCCYRDARWSPDGDYLLFAFQDILGGENSTTQLYYINFGTIGQGLQYPPLVFPETFFLDRKSKPQPALRPIP